MKGNQPGSGWRTPAKHELINRLVGEEIGAGSRLPNITRHVWYDLTAGSAAMPADAEVWHRSCSPGILAHHARWSHGKPVVVLLYEHSHPTFELLLHNLERYLPALGYETEPVGRHRPAIARHGVARRIPHEARRRER